MRRWGAILLTSLGGLIVAAPVALAADNGVDDLPDVSDSTLQSRITDISIDRIVDIRLDGRVGDLEVESTEGAETVVRLDSDILFEFGESKLPEAAPTQIGELMADVPDGAGVSISGHTDNIGEPASNQTLSEQRAQAVADVIEAARPDFDLVIEGFGETEPIEPNESDREDNPEGRAQNRRVEIRYAT